MNDASSVSLRSRAAGASVRRSAAVVAIALLAATTVAAAQDRCDNCGRIASIRSYTPNSSWTPLGSMPSSADRNAPGQVTTQYNFTSGNFVMLGAAGGAGYAKRPNSYERPRWEIVVTMDDGTTRTVSHSYEPALQQGDRVRVFGTQLELER